MYVGVGSIAGLIVLVLLILLLLGAYSDSETLTKHVRASRTRDEVKHVTG